MYNGGVLFASNAFSTGVRLAQMILLTRYLSAEGYGVYAIIMAYVIAVNKLIDLRVSETTVKFGSAYLAKQNHTGLAAIFKLSYLLDFLTGVIAFALVIGTAPWATTIFLDDPALTPLIQLYALTLLISTVDNTSNSVLRVFDRFKWISAYGMAMSALELGVVVIAIALDTQLEGIIIAIICKDALSALINASLSLKTIKDKLGFSMVFQTPIRYLRARSKELFSFLMHTNIMAYFRMINTRIDVLILGFFHSNEVVGIYKFARELATMVARVSDPFIGAILPDLSRLWSHHKFKAWQALIVRSSAYIGVILVLVSLAAMFFSPFIVELVAGSTFELSAPVFSICIWGFCMGGIFFWTWPAALSMQRPEIGTRVGLIVVFTQLVLAFALVPQYGAVGNAIALLGTYVVGQPLMAWMVFRSSRLQVGATIEAYKLEN